MTVLGKPQDHHWVPQQAIKSAHSTWRYNARLTGESVVSLSRLLNDRRNISRLKPQKHADHEHSPKRVLTRADVPPEAEEFAAEYGFENELDRRYGERELD